MSEFLKIDYQKFSKEIVKSSKSLFKIDAALELDFRKHHKSMYFISLTLSKLKHENKEENKIIFLAEIVSDLLTVTKLLFLGLETPALILLRRAIENFYNHIFYSDHPIEYQHLNLGKNDYTPIDKLKLYFDTHPKFIDSEDPNLKDYNQSLFNEYHRLCKVVHSKGKDSMNLAKCLKDLSEDFEISDILKQLNKIEVFIIYLTYKFHKDIKFTPIEKAIITSIVPANKRSQLNE